MLNDFPNDPEALRLIHASDAEAERELKTCWSDEKLSRLRDACKRRAQLFQNRIDEIRGS